MPRYQAWVIRMGGELWIRDMLPLGILDLPHNPSEEQVMWGLRQAYDIDEIDGTISLMEEGE